MSAIPPPIKLGGLLAVVIMKEVSEILLVQLSIRKIDDRL